ncbi:MAG: PDZ domain-containing protein [Oscillospiraceae bacterium]|nr:PDZ domain-containing protein [Oscillospiraceae bacterium]
MKRKWQKRCALVLALCMMLSAVALAADVDYGAKLDEALEIYRKNGLFADNKTDYVREALVEMFKEDPQLFYTLVNKIYERDDRYSHYLKAQDYGEMYVMSSSMVGIGVVITTSDDGYLVVKSVSEGPAERAGILPGDKLVEVDGMNIEGYLPAQAGTIIRGREGTKVKVTVLRDGQRRTFDITREKVRVSDVTSYKVNDKVGYIKLANFGGITSFIDFMKAYDEFETDEVNTVILDLRDNPGGQLDCLTNIMDNIIPEKNVPYLMSWQTKPLNLRVYQSAGYGWEFNKFVILINENTASAAEIMAGSLSDLGYAVVVGEKSFGKGLGQKHLKTSTGDEAVITSLELKLPTSGSYDGKGILPDYHISLTKKPYKLPYLPPLENKKAISKIKTENIRAVEARLYELGYFYDKPDDNWDNKTVNAINMFCRDMGIEPISSTCSWELIEKIDAAAQALEKKYIIEDTQLAGAIKIAEQFSKSDKKAKCIDLNQIDFN